MTINTNATPETVWTLLQEMAQRMEASKAEHDRMIAESAARMEAMSKEADKRQQELADSQKKTDRQIEESAARMEASKAEHDRMIAETAARMEAMSKETDKKFQETAAQMKESDRKFQAMSKEADKRFEKTERLVKELSINVGGNNRSIGELVETLVAARLWKKFAAYPYNLERAYRRVPIYDEHNQLKSDIDILLADTHWCMAVEVKREANKDDVERHLKRMDLIRTYPPAEVAGKKMLGAVAGGVVLPEAKEFAHECGFFVLELKGESVELLDAPAGFTAREW